ncbi:MAG TPA: twin-arginine translocase TatA/TatE family subunit [Terracidiphilus sp.]|nr:twin-arginine translocase TatA/TatE family subunit [Terracidiphilus sp.]
MGIPVPIETANFSMGDSLLIMVIALVVLGPRRLPQVGRQIGKLMYEFRKASNDFKFQMEEELRTAEEADRRKREEAERQRQLALNPPAPGQPAESTAATTAEQSEASSTTSESALPRESTHGDFGGQPAETEPTQAGQAQTEASVPRILPPSTGETVAAARPGSGGAANGTSAPASNDAAETKPETTNAVTEQVTHNG